MPGLKSSIRDPFASNIQNDELETNPLTNTPYSNKMICKPKFLGFLRILLGFTGFTRFRSDFILDFEPEKVSDS